MALIVDDSVDVWGGDLGNLCLTRRFVGDKSDDGLQLLGGQLMQVHSQFFKGAPSEGYSLEAPSGSPRCPPNVFSVLSGSRGDVFRGCRIALTGIVSDLSEETLAVEGVPLAGLIQLYGGELCLSVDQATHLVARRKEGWKSSPKVKKALNRIKVGALSRTLPSDRCGAHPCHPRQHFFCTRCAKSQRARARQKHQRPSRGSSIFRRKAFTWSEARGKAGCRSFSCLLTMNKRLKGCRAEGPCSETASPFASANRLPRCYVWELRNEISLLPLTAYIGEEKQFRLSMENRVCLAGIFEKSTESDV